MTELDARRSAPILLVADLERARDFWLRELGFEVQAEAPGAGLLQVARQGQSLTLWERSAVERELGSLAREMGDAGSFFIREPDHQGDGRRVLSDPDGHRVVFE